MKPILDWLPIVLGCWLSFCLFIGLPVALYDATHPGIIPELLLKALGIVCLSPLILYFVGSFLYIVYSILHKMFTAPKEFFIVVAQYILYCLVATIGIAGFAFLFLSLFFPED